MKSQKIHVFGKVQGVYFRSSAKQQADLIGVTGRVRNEKDGSVCVEVEGADSAVERMITWCKEGPALARVSEIKTSEWSQQNYTSFDIDR